MKRAAGILGGLLFFLASFAHAQNSSATPWLTWRAVTYIPPSYQGRALPIPGSKLIGALDVIERGKAADLSNETTYWYLNGSVLQTGMGLTRISFEVPGGTEGGAIELKAVLPDYKGGLARSIRIPVSSPRAELRAIYRNQVSSRSFSLLASPYYFNVSDPSALDVQWTVNGEPAAAAGDPFRLDVTLGPSFRAGNSLPIRLRMNNPDGDFEFAVRDLNLTFAP